MKTEEQIDKINDITTPTDNLDYYIELSAHLLQRPHKEPEKKHCIFCMFPMESKGEFMGGYNFLIDILRLDFQQKHGVEIKAVNDDDYSLCYHTKAPKEQKDFLLNWSIPIHDSLQDWLEQTSNVDRAFAGLSCADVDISRPSELLKLLADKETLDFVLLRGYDIERKRLEEIQKVTREEYKISYEKCKDFLAWFNSVEVDSMESFVKKLKAIYGHLIKLKADPSELWFRNNNQFEAMIMRASWILQNKDYEDKHRKELNNLSELYNQVKDTVKNLKLADWSHIPFSEIKTIHQQERHSSIRIDEKDPGDVAEFKDWLQRAELKFGRKHNVRNFESQEALV